MFCKVCGCWVEIEEPNPTDLSCFICDECLETAEDEPKQDGIVYPGVSADE